MIAVDSLCQPYLHLLTQLRTLLDSYKALLTTVLKSWDDSILKPQEQSLQPRTTLSTEESENSCKFIRKSEFLAFADEHLKLNMEDIYFPFINGQLVYQYYFACKEAKRLGIKSQAEYSERYLQGQGLPQHPEALYAADWHSWHVFLGC